MAYSLSVSMCLPTIQHSTGRREKVIGPVQSKSLDLWRGVSILSRRQVVVGCAGTSLVSCLMINWFLAPLAAFAGEGEEKDEEGLVGALKSLFDPNEKTKSGKVLPKAYLSSAREVVKTLRESLNEDPKDMAKFRRTADAAKESIRGYINDWRGQKTVVNEESYVMLEKAIRALAGFYARAGPSAPLPEDIKSEVLGDLSAAEQFL